MHAARASRSGTRLERCTSWRVLSPLQHPSPHCARITLFVCRARRERVAKAVAKEARGGGAVAQEAVPSALQPVVLVGVNGAPINASRARGGGRHRQCGRVEAWLVPERRRSCVGSLRLSNPSTVGQL